MAAHLSTRNLPTNNLFSRRTALHGAASVGALAVPAGVALTIEATKLSAAAPDDPLIEMWRERMVAYAAAEGAAGPDECELNDRVCEIELRINETPAVSPEGAAIVATLVIDWVRIGILDYNDGGPNLARYILANTPADVLRRAGLEG